MLSSSEVENEYIQKNAQGISVSPLCPVGTTEIIRTIPGNYLAFKKFKLFFSGDEAWGVGAPQQGGLQADLLGGSGGAEPPEGK